MSIGSSAVVASLRSAMHMHRERVATYNQKVKEFLKGELTPENINEILDNSHWLELNTLKSLWNKIDCDVKRKIIINNFDSKEWLKKLVSEKMITKEQYLLVKCSILTKEEELFLILFSLLVIPTISSLIYTGVKEFLIQEELTLSVISVGLVVVSFLIPIIYFKKYKKNKKEKIAKSLENIKKLVL